MENSKFSKEMEILQVPIASPALCLKYSVISRCLLESEYVLKYQDSETACPWGQPEGSGMENPV